MSRIVLNAVKGGIREDSLKEQRNGRKFLKSTEIHKDHLAYFRSQNQTANAELAKDGNRRFRLIRQWRPFA